MEQFYKISHSSLKAIADGIRALILDDWEMTPAQMAAQLKGLETLHCETALSVLTTVVKPTSTAKAELLES